MNVIVSWCNLSVCACVYGYVWCQWNRCCYSEQSTFLLTRKRQNSRGREIYAQLNSLFDCEGRGEDEAPEASARSRMIHARRISALIGCSSVSARAACSRKWLHRIKSLLSAACLLVLFPVRSLAFGSAVARLHAPAALFPARPTAAGTGTLESARQVGMSLLVRK
jgi:hypothetical protein